jgi:hypothetical protein
MRRADGGFWLGGLKTTEYKLLGERAAAIDLGVWDAFQGKNSFEHETFTALEYACIGVRYDKRYVIDEASLIYLDERVELLLKRTEAVCRQMIAELREVVGVEIRTISRTVRVAEFSAIHQKKRAAGKMMIFGIELWLQGGFGASQTPSPKFYI